MKRDRIVLVGFMGCGKTSVASALAQLLDAAFVDLDSLITTRESRSPADLIQQEGERSFRDIETRALRKVMEQDGSQVIAFGGGAWTIEENRALVESHGYLAVWLDAPFELCWSRIQSGDTVRPLAPDRKAAQALYQSRRQTYELASLKLAVDEPDSPESIARRILQSA
jgi:shikimate kinase